MKKSKKFLSVFLAFCMALGMLPMSVLAAEGKTEVTIKPVLDTTDEPLLDVEIVLANGEPAPVTDAKVNVYYISNDTNVYIVEDSSDTTGIELPSDPGSYKLYIEVSENDAQYYSEEVQVVEYTIYTEIMVFPFSRYYTMGDELPALEGFGFVVNGPIGEGEDIIDIEDIMDIKTDLDGLDFEMTTDADWETEGEYSLTIAGPEYLTTSAGNTYALTYQKGTLIVTPKREVILGVEMDENFDLSVTANPVNDPETEVTIELFDVYYVDTATGTEVELCIDAAIPDIEAALLSLEAGDYIINIYPSQSDENYVSMGTGFECTIPEGLLDIEVYGSATYFTLGDPESDLSLAGFEFGDLEGCAEGDDYDSVKAALEQCVTVTIGPEADLTVEGEYPVLISGPATVSTENGVYAVMKYYDGVLQVTTKRQVELSVSIDEALKLTVTAHPVNDPEAEVTVELFRAYYWLPDEPGGYIISEAATLEEIQAAVYELEPNDYQLMLRPSREDENYVGYGWFVYFTVPEKSGSDETEDATPAPTPSQTVTVPVPAPGEGETGSETGDDVTANVQIEATVSGTTASVTVSGEEIAKAVADGTGGEGGDAPAQQPSGVVIDLSGLDGEIKAAELPSETLQTVLDAVRETPAPSDAPVLTLKLSSGTVTFDSAALEAVVNQADGRKVQFKVNVDADKGTSYLSSAQREAVKDKEIFAGVDAYAFNNGGRISDFKGGSVEMSIPFDIPEGYKAGGFSVWYVSEDGELVKHRTTWKNGRFFWTVNHWSDYIIAYDESDISVYPDENGGTAHASTVKVVVDGGEAVDMYAYALQDEEGNSTNYVKLRDIAALLNGTAAQFEVGYDGAVNLEDGKAYTAVGGELAKTFEGDHPYTAIDVDTRVDGVVTDIAAFCLHLENGDGYNYYQLRDVGRVLGFNVAWDEEAKAIVIQTGKPYTGTL